MSRGAASSSRCGGGGGGGGGSGSAGAVARFGLTALGACVGTGCGARDFALATCAFAVTATVLPVRAGLVLVAAPLVFATVGTLTSSNAPRLLRVQGRQPDPGSSPRRHRQVRQVQGRAAASR